MLKKDCILIKIPHYSFSGYYYPYDILNDDNINNDITKEDLQIYINNLLNNKESEVIQNLNTELNHIKELDLNSDIECFEFIKNNYNKKL